MSDKKSLFLLDAYALIYRGYYAFIKNPRINSKGLDTSAILGFTNSLFEIIRSQKPDYIGVAFDKGGSVTRSEMFVEYKSNRDKTPEPIIMAIPYIKNILEGMNIPILEQEGFEADDIIGTVAKKAEKKNFKVFMVTPDKDFSQLVSENIFLCKPARMGNGMEIWGTKEVNEKFEINVSHDSNLDEVKELLESKYQIESESTTVGELVFDIFENYIEHDIVDPVFVTDYPKEVSPFARESDEKMGITERFELFAFGSELANGFSELIDPVDQENRLKSQAEKKAAGDEEAHVEDSDYIEALEFGLPPTGGLGFGVDRFVMMITNNDSIREVIAFPHLKPEN